MSETEKRSRAEKRDVAINHFYSLLLVYCKTVQIPELGIQTRRSKIDVRNRSDIKHGKLSLEED